MKCPYCNNVMQKGKLMSKGGVMKKTRMLLMVTIFILSSSLTVLAGDIPESLLHSDDAQIFFGEVLAYHSNKENPSIEVFPVVAIKGNVKEGTKQTYLKPNPVGNISIVEGKVYLFTYYDDANPTDIFEVTTYDTRTLKLKHVEGDMWERFEKYLNEGKYGEAKIEGMMPYTVDIAYGVGLGVLFVVAVGLGFVVKKNKRRKR